jgi:hypothetical protein
VAPVYSVQPPNLTVPNSLVGVDLIHLELHADFLLELLF